MMPLLMTKRLFAKTGLSLQRLQTFVEVVGAGGISSAAPGDPNRQSQFSRQLTQLEEFFGAELFRRGRGRFALTSAGRELFQVVQSYFNALDDLVVRFENQNVEVTVGGGESYLHSLLLPSLAAFRSKHPKVALALENLRTEEITVGLTEGRIDIGLLGQEAIRPPLKSVRLGTVEYRLVLPRQETIRRSPRDFWKALADLPIALLADSKVAAAFEKEAEERGVPLKIALRGSSYAQLVAAVPELGCAALMPSFVAHGMDDPFPVIPLPFLKAFARQVALAWNPRTCAVRPIIKDVVGTLTGILRKNFAGE